MGYVICFALGIVFGLILALIAENAGYERAKKRIEAYEDSEIDRICKEIEERLDE